MGECFSVFHVFQIEQVAPNRAKRLICTMIDVIFNRKLEISQLLKSLENTCEGVIFHFYAVLKTFKNIFYFLIQKISAFNLEFIKV